MNEFQLNYANADIVIVDDTLPNLQVLADMLSERSYEVRGAPDGHTALMIIRAQPPDLILLDIQMPGMDGYEVCEQLKADEFTCGIPVIFISALDDVFDKVRGFEVGGVDYITKPFQLEEVLARVDTHLALRDLQKQMQQALVREMQLNEMRARFLAMASHDLRNPLAVIQSATDTLSHYSDRLSEDKKQARFDQIRKSIKQMLELLDDVLTIAKTEAGALEFNPEPIDLTTFCTELVNDFQASLGSEHHFAVSVNGACSGAIMDPKLLRHILSNLLSNAIKYSPEGRTVTFELTCSDHETVFRIQDEGIGIPEAAQKRLFEAFHRADNVDTVPGTGLGLAIVKQSVELHGGTIAFKSKKEVGTTFIVTIPNSFGSLGFRVEI
jgi:two-component system, sensor histidine kinase and response regulator